MGRLEDQSGAAGLIGGCLGGNPSRFRLGVRGLGQPAGQHDVTPRDEDTQERNNHREGFVVRLDPGPRQVIHGLREDHRDHRYSMTTAA